MYPFRILSLFFRDLPYLYVGAISYWIPYPCFLAQTSLFPMKHRYSHMSCPTETLVCFGSNGYWKGIKGFEKKGEEK